MLVTLKYNNKTYRLLYEDKCAYWLDELGESEDFKNILSLSENRGPDHTGIYNNKNIQLGFNRLKIIDLTNAGNQPIISQDNRFAMVYNGEVYNYKEIKKTTKFKIKDNITDIELEITKKDWLRTKEVLCAQFPELYEA